MASPLYSEPNYVLPEPAASILSEARPAKLSPAALLALNYVQDELLHIWVHAALSPSTGPASSTVGSPTPSAGGTGPLAPNETLTTEKLKAGVVRVMGAPLGKSAALEGEMAVRELLRTAAPSLRGDGALRKTSFGAGAIAFDEGQADEVFRSLRGWVGAISGLGAGCPSSDIPASNTDHLASLTPPPRSPTPSPHVTFLTALYAERLLTHIADYILRAIGRVLERQPSKEAATLEEVEAALAEDEALWKWVRGMRVRAYIEAELQKERVKSGGPPQGGFASPVMGRASTSLSGRNSIDSVGSSAKGLLYGGGSKKGDSGDAFEQLMQSGKTMKVSLTPDRLRTMEVQKLERSRSSLPSSSSVPTLATTVSSAPTPPSPSASPSQPKRRLQARPPRDLIQEDEEEDDPDALSAPGTPPRRKNPKGESLMELLHSPPPWAGNDERFQDDPAGVTMSRTLPSSRGGSAQGEGGEIAGGRVGPRSASMQQQASYQSVNSVGSAFSSGSEVEAWLNLPPEERAKKLVVKPKNEREDLAHERQINHDLVDFFAAPPPAAEDHSFAASLRSDDRRQSIQSTATAQSQAPLNGNGVAKKKSGGFLGFMRGKDKAPASSPTPAATAPAPPPIKQQAAPPVTQQQPPRQQAPSDEPGTPEPDGWPTYAKGRRSSSSDPSRKPPTKYRTEVDPAKAQAAAARAAALAGGNSPAIGSAASAAYSPPQPRRVSHSRSDSLRSEMVSPMTGPAQLPAPVPEVEAAAGAFAGGKRMAAPPKTPADFDPNQRSETPVTDGGRDLPAMPSVVHGLGISEESPVTVERAAEPAGSEASVSDAGSKKMRRKANGIVIAPRTQASGVVAPVEVAATQDEAKAAEELEVPAAQSRLSVPSAVVDSTSVTSNSPYVDAASSVPESDVEDNLEPAPHKARLQPPANIEPAPERSATATPPPRSLHRVESPTPSHLRSPSRQSQFTSPSRLGVNGTPASVKKPEVSLTSTLLALRVGMVSAKTAEECLALLDQMLWHSTNEERRGVEGEGAGADEDETEELAEEEGEEETPVAEGEAEAEAESAAAPTVVEATPEPAATPEDAQSEATPDAEEAALFEYFLGGSSILPPKQDAPALAEPETAPAPATEELGHSLPSEKAVSAGLTAADERETPTLVIPVDERDTVFAAPGGEGEEASRSVTPVPPGGFA